MDKLLNVIQLSPKSRPNSARIKPIREYTGASRGDWLRLPSGHIVEVCKIMGESSPDVSLRYLDDDGVMATGDFIVKLSWLVANSKNVGRA